MAPLSDEVLGDGFMVVKVLLDEAGTLLTPSVTGYFRGRPRLPLLAAGAVTGSGFFLSWTADVVAAGSVQVGWALTFCGTDVLLFEELDKERNSDDADETCDDVERDSGCVFLAEVDESVFSPTSDFEDFSFGGVTGGFMA